MKTIKLYVDKLSNGKFTCRPSEVGMCGWYPFSWTIAIESSGTKATKVFCKHHEKQLEDYKIEIVDLISQ